MSFIVHASVAVKWGVEEPGADKAFALLSQGPLMAPDLIAPDVASALWKKNQRGEISGAQLAFSFDACLRSIDEIVSTKDLAERALELAVALKHPVYDCFYLALAEARGATLVTADTRLLRTLAEQNWQGAHRAL